MSHYSFGIMDIAGGNITATKPAPQQLMTWSELRTSRVAQTTSGMTAPTLFRAIQQTGTLTGATNNTVSMMPQGTGPGIAFPGASGGGGGASPPSAQDFGAECRGVGGVFDPNTGHCRLKDGRVFARQNGQIVQVGGEAPAKGKGTALLIGGAALVALVLLR